MLLDRLIRRVADERGSALMAVIGVFAVTLIVSVTIASATFASVGFTTATRANVQATAAAESGVNAVAAALQMTGCPSGGTLSSASDPTFSARLLWTEYDTDEAARSHGAWHDGCPSTSALLIKVVSTGTATAKGVVGNASGDQHVVEAIFSTVRSSPGIVANGAALYAYSASGFSGSGGILAGSGAVPSVQIRHGNLTCSGGSPTYADVLVADGTFTGSGSCKINGYIYASDDVTFSGVVPVGGNVIGKNLDINGAIIAGSVWATDPSGKIKVIWGAVVGGNSTSNKLEFAGGNIKGTAWATGSATTTAGGTSIDGNLVAKSFDNSTVIRGTKTIVPAGPGPGPAVPARPVVPDWVDFDYRLSDWTGFAETVLTGANCTQAKLTAALMLPGTGVIDMRTCSGVTLDGSNKVSLGGDKAVFAKKYSLGAGAGFLSSSTNKIWLITPDSNSDHALSCPVSEGGVAWNGVRTDPAFKVDGGFTLVNVSALVYTPCTALISSGVQWTGQVFAGNATVDGNAKIDYRPLGLPGYDLGTGLPTAPGAGAGSPSGIVLTSRVSIRDLN